MLRKIKLYGHLKEITGFSVLEAEVANAAQAVKFLITNWPELDRHMADQYYEVDVGTTALKLDELHYPAGSDDIKIIPIVGGAGNAGRIILGAALIAFAVYSGGAGLSILSAPVITKAGIGWYALTAKIGMLLVLSGIAGFLTPVPDTPDVEGDPTKSFSFSGVQQTGRSGTAIPVIYGEVITGSIVVSGKIDVDEVDLT
tara:strand:+ start:3248 stop:3847 length:600 start_codon:yes stop_codon:yes gene_type:complete